MAREALRAARAKSRQEAADAADETGAPARRLPPPVAGPPSREAASRGARGGAEPFAGASPRRGTHTDVEETAGEPGPGAVRPDAGGPGRDPAGRLRTAAGTPGGEPARRLSPTAAGTPVSEPAPRGVHEDIARFADASLRRAARADVEESAGEPGAAAASHPDVWEPGDAPVPGAGRPAERNPGNWPAADDVPAPGAGRPDTGEAGTGTPAGAGRPDPREPGYWPAAGDAPAPGAGRPDTGAAGTGTAPGVGRPAARRPGSEAAAGDAAAPRAARPAVRELRADPAPHATPSNPRPPSPPRSMAAPNRDSEHRRTFPALPPRLDRGEPTAVADEFAASWWGNAWVSALEEGALDVNRLVRGRGYAEQGHVDAITVTPGLVLAYVQGSRPRPYRVQVRLRTFGDEDWERFLDAAVESPAHIAALLDKEMPESLADCGVPLLPEPGDLAPQCSCPDRGHPCKHAAALCYQTARLLDADPFVLLLLRGRGERELLDALSRRNATRAARAAQEREPEPLPGIRATDALAARHLPPIPPPLPVPPHPGQPPAYPSLPDGGPDSFALDQLATDAATRAHALLATGRDEVGELTLWQDAVRLAAARPGSGLTATTRSLYSALAAAAGRTPAELARAVAAWRQGGIDGLTVLEEPWDPPAGRFDRARPLLLAADLPAFRPWRNHLTHPRGHVQLRFGREGLWYAYESEPGHDDWWPRGTPDPDPVGALTGLDGADDF
ncbi:SWIM zinc finger family protein [Streptomyces sp. NPDC001857]|uniref:SWIM zinc finger family protein n=1 Tax=unclassified Streptomyces TaxID=2593676 RepID=UPI00331FF1FB